jgi:glutathione S-transferase
MITIYNFPRGARGVRAFWVCEEMGLPYRAEAVSYPPSAAYLARNPLGSVPFLTDDFGLKEDGGAAINESVAIMLYLAEHYGPTPLLPARDDPRFARVMQMTVFGETALGAYMNPLMMAKFAAPEGDKVSWLTRTLDGRVADAVAFAGAALGGQDYFAGDTFTLADISVSTALDMWKGALGMPVPEAMAAWRERVQERPAYQRAAAAQQR